MPSNWESVSPLSALAFADRMDDPELCIPKNNTNKKEKEIANDNEHEEEKEGQTTIRILSDIHP